MRPICSVTTGTRWTTPSRPTSSGRPTRCCDHLAIRLHLDGAHRVVDDGGGHVAVGAHDDQIGSGAGLETTAEIELVRSVDEPELDSRVAPKAPRDHLSAWPARVVSTVKAADSEDGDGVACYDSPRAGTARRREDDAERERAKARGPGRRAPRAGRVIRDGSARPSQLAGMALDVVDDQISRALDVAAKTLGGERPASRDSRASTSGSCSLAISACAA